MSDDKWELLEMLEEIKEAKEKAEAELAKREKALEQAMRLGAVYDCDDRWNLEKCRPEWVMKTVTPELAEWLKGRDK